VHQNNLCASPLGRSLQFSIPHWAPFLFCLFAFSPSQFPLCHEILCPKFFCTHTQFSHSTLRPAGAAIYLSPRPHFFLGPSSRLPTSRAEIFFYFLSEELFTFVLAFLSCLLLAGIIRPGLGLRGRFLLPAPGGAIVANCLVSISPTLLHRKVL